MIFSKFHHALIAFLHQAKMDSVSIRRSRLESLHSERKSKDPKAISGFGYKIYSQSDEDGVIDEIFRRIGTKSRKFIEFGVGDGLENNTASLLYLGWTGLWIEGSPDYCDKIRNGMSSLLANGTLKLLNAYVSPDNIDELISSSIGGGEIDLLSVDIDGNDAHVLKRITCINPRVIVLEYNAKYGPRISYCMSFKSNHVWSKTDNFGASLKFYELLMNDRGYSLVGCNVVGTNAFFIRSDLIGDNFSQPFTSEHHFEPARYELAGLPSGHPASYMSFNELKPTSSFNVEAV